MLAITNQALTVKFVLDNGDEYLIDKDNMYIKKKFGKIIVSNGNFSSQAFQKLKFGYDEVSNLVLSSNDELITTLIGYKINSGSIGHVVITDGTSTVPLEPNRSLPVTIQDQTTPVVMSSFSILEAQTTMTANQVIGDYTITVASATGISAGKMVTIFSPTAIRFSQFICVGILGLVVTLNSPLDFAYQSGSYVDISELNLAVNGAVTPVVAGVRNNAGAVPPPGIDLTVDITRITLTCLTTAAPTLSAFGDIAGGLTNGIFLRRRDGEYYNIGAARTNAEFANMMPDFEIYAALGWGQDGFRAAITFGGQDNFGVVLRLAIYEDLEVIIQDDLSSLTSLHILAQGSIVQN